MRVAVVINSASGGLLDRAGLVDEIDVMLAEAGFEPVNIPADGRGLMERMDAAFALGAERVIVGGGDGTIACAAQRLMGTDTALGILPLGTMNLLAKDLGIPMDVGEAVTALAAGDVGPIDVAEVNGHVFLCSSVLGFPTHVAERRERERRSMSPLAWWRLAVAAVKSLYRYPPLHVAVDLGKGPVQIRTHALAIADNAFDDGFGHFMARSRLDQGELVLYFVRDLSVWRLGRLAAGMAVGGWKNDPNLETHHVKRIRVASRRRLLRVMNDGEVRLLAPPLDYRVLPGALNVVLPKQGAPELET